MKTAIFLAALLVAISANLQAQTVVQNSNLAISAYSGQPPANYAFTVYQNIAGTDPTSVFFKYDGSHMQAINTNIDQGSDWYIVHSGDEFSRANVAAGQFPTLIQVSPGTPIPGPSLTVGTGDFWLGVATGTVLFGERTVYGWVHLHPTAPFSTTLQMVDNVMTYNSLGVIVGTTTALVPEPSSIAMAACALASCLSGGFWRRK
jgi:hypothetical protein